MYIYFLSNTMFFKRNLCFQILICWTVVSQALWEFPPTGDQTVSTSHNSSDIKTHENQILLQLARLHTVSPERIILLITRSSLAGTCSEVRDVLKHMNIILEATLEARVQRLDNLYLNLYRGIDYYYDFICTDLDTKPKTYIRDYHACFKELHEDLIDCEGPPDWFEKDNESVVCKYFNDIINCNYVKAAMLCGLKPALMLRTLSDQILRYVLPYNCKTSRRLPIVPHPMNNTISSNQRSVAYLYSKIAMVLLTRYIFH